MQTRERHPFAPTRRSLAGLLAATAALAVPATIAAAAPAEPDAELIALGRELEAAWAVERAVCIELRDDDSDAGQARLDEVCGRCSAITERIEGLAAATLAGLRVKLRALEWCVNGDPLDVNHLFGHDHATTDHRLIAAILTDLRAAA